MFNATRFAQFVSVRSIAFLFLLPIGVACASSVTEEDIRAQYDLDVSLLTKQTEYLVSQIVTDNEEAAKAAITRLAAGEAFEDVARGASNDMSSRSKGGDLGWAAPARYFPEIEAALLATKPGETSKTPIHTKLGWHILKVREVRAAVPPSYESQHDKISKAISDAFTHIDGLSSQIKREASPATAQSLPTEYLVSHILTGTREDALAALARINRGEPFADVARAASIDTGSAVKGGDLGWNGMNTFVTTFTAAMAATPRGTVTQEPVRSQFGWHLIFVRDTRLAAAGKTSAKGISQQAELDNMFFNWPAGPAVVRHLVDVGANPNAIKNGGSVLGANCYSSSLTSVRILLAAGADANLRAGTKVSPLDGCIQGNDSQNAVPVLLNGGAQLNQPDNAGYYPLSVAAAANRPALIELFTRRGSVVDQHNGNGSTALSLAAWEDSLAVVQALLGLGANPLEHVGGSAVANVPFDTAVSAAYQRRRQRKMESKALPVLRKAATDAAILRSTRKMSVFVVQDGKRQALNGHTITLKRAPFSLDFIFSGGNDVMVHASSTNDTINWIRQNTNEGDFGDEFNATHEDDQNNQMLVVSDLANFKFHHWVVISGKSHLELQSHQNGELKARRQIQTLRLEDIEHADSTDSAKTISVAQMDKPLYLTVAIGEPIGRPYTAVTQLQSTEINWR